MFLKEHWTSITSSPTFSPKSWDFCTIRSVGIDNDYILSFTFYSRLTYFWRNMNISSIFYFSKSTSINTQYSSLWDTLKMMLFTKYFIKWNCVGRISWKFWHWFDLKSSTELVIKDRCYTCLMSLSWGGTHMLRHTGMCRPNGLLFHQKSLDMGPILVKKILTVPFHKNCKKIVKSAIFEVEKTLRNGSQFTNISKKT